MHVIVSSLLSDDLKYPGLHGHTADATSVVLLNMGHDWHLSVLLSVFLKVKGGQAMFKICIAM